MLPPAYAGVHHMAQAIEGTHAPHLPTAWLACPLCRAHMLLTRVEEPIPGHLLHMFECDGCGSAQVMRLDKNSEAPTTMKWVLSAVRPFR
jgi:hypothetical protein